VTQAELDRTPAVVVVLEIPDEERCAEVQDTLAELKRQYVLPLGALD